LVTISTTYSELDKLNYKNCIITIGSFDGIHLGHKKIFDKMNNLSKHKSIKNNKVLITFDPHPIAILKKEMDTKYYLSESVGEKIEILNNSDVYDIDIVIILEFNKSLSKITASDFFNKIIKSFSPTDVVMGYDNGFGYKREGDIDFLKENYSDKEFQLHSVNPEHNKGKKVISSSLIRAYIQTGKINKANLMLGRYYSLNGIVVKGQSIGRTIDFPTINILPNNQDQITPFSGVYFVHVIIGSDKYTGMCNIGIRPTVTNNKEETIEIHIFRVKRSKDFYGNEVKICFVDFIREEKKFDNIEFLAKQLKKDKKYCLSIKD
jgi:riboflavin kinase / FMN adenylyltransferase